MVVYFHRNPVTYEIFYVGIGKEDNRAYNTKGRSKFWFNYVSKYGKPIIQIVQKNVEKKVAFEWEKFYISLLGKKNEGGQLVNITNGGETSPMDIPEVKERMITSLKIFNKNNPDKIERHKNIMKELMKNEDYKNRTTKKLLEWAKANPDKNSMKRPEVRAKLSGDNNSSKRPEVREKLRIANLGKKASPETRLKQSLLKLGKPSTRKNFKHSDKTKAKMKIINKEITNRPEVKAKLRLSTLGKPSKKRIPVAMIDKTTNEVLKTFSYIGEAGQYFGKPRTGNITAVLKGNRNFAFGYKWSYVLSESSST